MSDTVPAPAFLDAPDFQEGRPKRRRTPEHTFQAWVDRLLDRIVVPPMFTTGIDHASQTTDNARARMQGRGIKFGLPDVFVCQAPQSPGAGNVTLWIELKRGTGLSPAQEGVHNALRAAGQSVVVCSSMAGVVAGLRNYGFDVHANADSLALEYEHRVQASEKAPRVPKQSRKRPFTDSRPSRRALAFGAKRVLG